MHGDDVLSVIFLALICVVISAIVMKLAPDHSNLIVPSFAFISIGLWIAYDYMLQSRMKQKEKCLNDKYNRLAISEMVDEINHKAYSNSDHDIEHDMDDNKALDHNGKPKDPDAKETKDVIPEPKKESIYEFDIDMYNNQNIQEVYTHMANSGDTQICNRMKYMSMQPKLSQDIRASFNKHSIEPYFIEELRSGEDLAWWGDNDDIYGDL